MAFLSIQVLSQSHMYTLVLCFSFPTLLHHSADQLDCRFHNLTTTHTHTDVYNSKYSITVICDSGCNMNVVLNGPYVPVLVSGIFPTPDPRPRLQWKTDREDRIFSELQLTPTHLNGCRPSSSTDSTHSFVYMYVCMFVCMCVRLQEFVTEQRTIPRH